MFAAVCVWLAGWLWAVLVWVWWAAGWACQAVGAFVICGRLHAAADRAAAWLRRA